MMTMMMSAFGIEDNRLSKADNRRSVGRSAATGAAVGGVGAGAAAAGGITYYVARGARRMERDSGVPHLPVTLKRLGRMGRIAGPKLIAPAAAAGAATGAAAAGTVRAVRNHRNNRLSKADDRRRDTAIAGGAGAAVGGAAGGGGVYGGTRAKLKSNLRDPEFQADLHGRAAAGERATQQHMNRFALSRRIPGRPDAWGAHRAAHGYGERAAGHEKIVADSLGQAKKLRRVAGLKVAGGGVGGAAAGAAAGVGAMTLARRRRQM